MQDIKRTSFVLFRFCCSFSINIGLNIPIYLKITDDKNINPIQEFKNEIKLYQILKNLINYLRVIFQKQTNLKLIENIKNYYKNLILIN